MQNVQAYSTRVTDIEPSATIHISELANELQEQGHDVIDMGAGDVHFVTPEHIRTAAIDALNRGETSMTPSGGLPELQEAISRKLQRENSLRVNEKNIIVTPGSKQAIFEAVFSLLNDGDTAVTLDPSWVSYKAIIRMAGGRPKGIDLNPNSGFTPSGVDFAEHVSDDVKLLVLNNPSNPTGAVFDRDHLREIRDLACDHDFYVLSDEIYEHLIFSEAEHISIASLDGMQERTITTNGFSKAYAMTGWRLGYYTAPDPLLEQARKVHTQTISSAPTFVQYGGVAALEGPQGPVDDMRQAYRTRRDIIMTEFRNADIHFPEPEAAFYAFVPVNAEDDVSLCKNLLQDAHVATTPGQAFGLEGYIRLSFPMDEDTIRDGTRRVVEYLDRNRLKRSTI